MARAVLLCLPGEKFLPSVAPDGLVEGDGLRNAEAALPRVAALTFFTDFGQGVVNLAVAITVDGFVRFQFVIARPSVRANLRPLQPGQERGNRLQEFLVA